MVIARTKLMIQDHLLKERPVFNIDYTGPRPSDFYTEVPRLLAAAFRVDVGQIEEKKISWSKGEPQKFSVAWEMVKDLDKFSYYRVELELRGTESKGYGTVSVRLKEGSLRTEYPQDTVWERSLLYELLRIIWHRIFYNRKREEWLREGRAMLITFIEELKKVMHEHKEGS